MGRIFAAGLIAGAVVLGAGANTLDAKRAFPMGPRSGPEGDPIVTMENGQQTQASNAIQQILQMMQNEGVPTETHRAAAEQKLVALGAPAVAAMRNQLGNQKAMQQDALAVAIFR